MCCPPTPHLLILVSYSVLEYTYLLFWNSFWTIAPVIAIGIFDRIVGMANYSIWVDVVLIAFLDDDVLMALPELYNLGRTGHWFGLKWFTIYMFDAVVQVRLFPGNISITVDHFPVCHYLFPDFLHVFHDIYACRWL